MIKVWDVCRVISRKKTDKSGLMIGDIVMVSSIKPLPVKRNDPYLQRIYMVVMIVTEDGIQIPAEGNDYHSYLVDPQALEVVSEDEALKYKNFIREQYGDTPS